MRGSQAYKIALSLFFSIEENIHILLLLQKDLISHACWKESVIINKSMSNLSLEFFAMQDSHIQNTFYS